MTAQAMLWTVAAVALAVAAAAVAADLRRNKRSDLDRVGWVPWRFIQVIGLLTALTAGALALQA